MAKRRLLPLVKRRGSETAAEEVERGYEAGQGARKDLKETMGAGDGGREVGTHGGGVAVYERSGCG